jgi:hypothetical protein
MIKIAHRGNTKGKTDRENSPTYIQESLQLGFDVEVDAWYVEESDSYFLGHDAPQFQVDLDFLMAEGLWVHCKHLKCFQSLLKVPEINCFMHDEESWKNGTPAVTSHQYLWSYPEVYTFDGKIYGICGDALL